MKEKNNSSVTKRSSKKNHPGPWFCHVYPFSNDIFKQNLPIIINKKFDTFLEACRFAKPYIEPEDPVNGTKYEVHWTVEPVEDWFDQQKSLKTSGENKDKNANNYSRSH